MILLVFRSEIGILTSTALLHRIVRQVTSDALVHEIVCFILGEQREPEKPTDINRHPLRHRLIEHCDHISDEVRNYNRMYTVVPAKIYYWCYCNTEQLGSGFYCSTTLKN